MVLVFAAQRAAKLVLTCQLLRDLDLHEMTEALSLVENALPKLGSVMQEVIKIEWERALAKFGKKAGPSD